MQSRTVPDPKLHPDRHAQSPASTTAGPQWRCSRCGKLLGVVRDGRLHLLFTRGHEYMVGLPATCICRGCRTLNELRDSPSQAVITRTEC